MDQRNKLLYFLMGLNENYEHVRNQILGMDALPTVNRADYYKTKGHVIDQCFKLKGSPNWYKKDKEKRPGRMAAHVSHEDFLVEDPLD